MQELESYRADRKAFLPTTWGDLVERGWDSPENPLDFAIVSGDAYVDHPSFGAAVIGRVLEADGFRVGIIAQPDWRSPEDFRRLGRPRLGFLVSAGNLDSMVANRTVSGKPRRQDAYSPGGVGGRRPDRATLVYCTRIREAFKKVDIVVGGIEASLRRLAHYDFWSDRVRRSLLLDSKADLLVYGMGERAVVRIARRLAAGERAGALRDVPGTVWKCRTAERASVDEVAERFGRAVVELPDWDALRDANEGTRAYAESFREQHRNTDALNADLLVERYGPTLVVQNPPALPLGAGESRDGPGSAEGPGAPDVPDARRRPEGRLAPGSPETPDTAALPNELDRIYELPYTRTFHPDYLEEGGVPAIEEVRFSLVSSRGCFGGCSFCSLSFHQGRRVTARSVESLVREATELTKLPGFKGNIHDVGGPTANFRRPSCRKQVTAGVCKDRQCLSPEPCRALQVDHEEYLEVLRRLRELPGVKKVFVRSGLRFDYLMLDENSTFLEELCMYHVSGRLKVAPEHIAPRPLDAMGKPGTRVYHDFARSFRRVNRELGKKQYLVPYFISSHPGTTIADAVALAEYFRDNGGSPEQVQDFYPTPGTLATCMYYTGIDPRSGASVPVPRTPREKAMQRALLQYDDPKNHALVREALELAGRRDLIGTGKKCLVPPASRRDAPPSARPEGKAGAGRKGPSNARPDGKPGAGRKRKGPGPGRNGKVGPRRDGPPSAPPDGKAGSRRKRKNGSGRGSRKSVRR